MTAMRVLAGHLDFPDAAFERAANAKRFASAKRHSARVRFLRKAIPLGVVLAADTHTSDPVSIGLNIELDAILAVVIGGGSLAGGRVYLGMTLLGVLVIQALTTSILTSGLPPEYNIVVKAIVVIIVLLLQSKNMRAALVHLFAGSKR